MAMAAPLVSVLIVLSTFMFLEGAGAVTFTFINSCKFTVWVGLQPNGGLPLLADGGFQVLQSAQHAVTAPVGWGGRFWGRTGCVFDAMGRGLCETGDCGGVLKCNGAGGNPPASLSEITLNGANGDDFYDISLVDGYNLPIAMKPLGGTGNCSAPGCVSNLNDNCPAGLQVVASGEGWWGAGARARRSGRRSTAARGRSGRPRRARPRSTRCRSRPPAPRRTATRTTTPPAPSRARRPPTTSPSALPAHPDLYRLALSLGFASCRWIDHL